MCNSERLLIDGVCTYEHFEWIEREGDTADGRRQVGLHVGVLAARAERLSLCKGHGDDAKVDSHLDVLTVLVGGQNKGIVITELKGGSVIVHL